MSDLRVKWQKGVRTWRLRGQARALVGQARRDGRTGPPLLVTNLSQMGDVILSAGVAAALRARHPDAPLVAAAQPHWREILEGDPALDGVLGIQSLFEVRALARSGLFGTVYVLDMPIPNLLDYLRGVPAIFRYAPPTTGDWFTLDRNLITFYERNAGLAEGEARPRLWTSPEDAAFAEALFAHHALTGDGPVIALHTHSSMEAKNWPMERWASLVTRWATERGARFLVLGGAGEAMGLASLPGVTHLAGTLTLKRTAAVIARSDFFLGLDGGLAYAAEAVGTPGLVVLGATVPETSGPRDRALFSFVRAPGACLPACHRACTPPAAVHRGPGRGHGGRRPTGGLGAEPAAAARPGPAHAPRCGADDVKLLVVSFWCPYPPDNGSRLRAYHLIRQLARRGHQIRLLALTQEESDSALAQREMGPLCALGVALFPSRFFRPGTARALLGFFSPRPRHLLDTHQPEAARAIARECRSGGYDAALALELGVAHYLPPDAPVRRVLDQLEVSGLVKAARGAGPARARLRRALTLAKLRAHLRWLAPRYAAWTAVSGAEADAVRGLAGAAAPPVRVLPNGVDLAENAHDPGAPYEADALVYNGALSFSANEDAVRWFAKAILPIIQRERAGVCLRVTGRNANLGPDDPLRRTPGVTLTGFLDDVRPAVRGAAACVVPLRQGGGTRLKILEAMALGTPVVATARGAEGIAARDGEDILIADAPAEFAAAALRLMGDPALRARVGAAGRRLVESLYGWDALGARLEALLSGPDESGTGK